MYIWMYIWMYISGYVRCRHSRHSRYESIPILHVHTKALNRSVHRFPPHLHPWTG